MDKLWKVSYESPKRRHLTKAVEAIDLFEACRKLKIGINVWGKKGKLYSICTTYDGYNYDDDEIYRREGGWLGGVLIDGKSNIFNPTAVEVPADL